ncbi:helix-turn-helix domain-containing protein [Microbispora sp. NEAU-D428]|uniref:arsenate reductase/protein-tyrosine-phosphatase family protein n=1 Tax=Microbispora sitophila TaxID=2771537 RepID=UPI0018686E3F|nr:ArsR family transcriptional regulator [Microbispora sitophila]MBE3015743.1 helix-turn-helix domain-containing protein [Microbispora sitophila]
MASSDQAVPAFVRLAANPLRWRLLTELVMGDLRVRELMALVGAPQNLVSYHLRLLRDGGLVTTTRSSRDGRDSYYRLNLDRCAQALAGAGAALHPALRGVPEPPAPPPRWPRLSVLFACTGNSARSPIAEALLRHHTADRVTVTSAGSRPAARVHPHAVRVLREQYGIDIADRRPRHLDTLRGRRFDYVITLCDKAREACPEFGDHARRIHWSTPDPAAAGQSEQDIYAALGRAAADIDMRIRYLLPVLAQTPEAHS